MVVVQDNRVCVDCFLLGFKKVCYCLYVRTVCNDFALTVSRVFYINIFCSSCGHFIVECVGSLVSKVEIRVLTHLCILLMPCVLEFAPN